MRTAARLIRRGLFAALGAAALVAQETILPSEGSVDASGETRPAARAPSEATHSPKPPLNPLDAYLSAWMRPGDHALLKKDPAAPSASEGWRRIAPAGGPAERKPPAKPAPSTNPYIIALNAAASPAAGAPALSGPPLPLNPAAPSMAAPVTLAEPGAPTPSTQTRYQPPPSSDTKYFPQLKRF